MKITIERTTKIVVLVTPDEGNILCRVWEGETAAGVKVHCFIPRIAAKEGQDLAQFEAELIETRAPSADVAAIPLRIIL